MAKYIYNVVKSSKPVPSHLKYGSFWHHWNIFGDKDPNKVDLRPGCSPVVDQGQLGSCTGNAIAAGLREFLLIKSGKFTPQDVVRLSRLFVYYEERLKEGTVNQDAGADISDGMNVILTLGIAPESEDPYNINTFTQAPTTQALRDALQYRVSSIQNLKNLNEVKHCLASGYPVVFGIEVFDSFESEQVAQTGVVPMPNANAEQNLGGHAICAVGYDDDRKVLIVRNSWGADWGDHGYFYLPYDYVNQYAWDFWTARI